MTRDELLFQIGYSIRLEKMQATLLARADRVSNFLQIFLGVAVVADAYPKAIGVAVAAVAAISFVCQPGAKSTEARAQKQKYEKLLAEESKLSDDEMRARYAELQESDSLVIGSLAHPAHMGEMIRLGHIPDFKLRWFEKVCAALAGDLPRP